MHAIVRDTDIFHSTLGYIGIITVLDPGFALNVSELGAGTWSIKVNYSSQNASGSSETKQITVK